MRTRSVPSCSSGALPRTLDAILHRLDLLEASLDRANDRLAAYQQRQDCAHRNVDRELDDLARRIGHLER